MVTDFGEYLFICGKQNSLQRGGGEGEGEGEGGGDEFGCTTVIFKVNFDLSTVFSSTHNSPTSSAEVKV